MNLRFSLRSALLWTACFAAWLASASHENLIIWPVGGVLLLIGIAIRGFWEYAIAISLFVGITLLLDLVFPILWGPAAVLAVVGFSIPLSVPFLTRERSRSGVWVAVFGIVALLAEASFDPDPRTAYFRAYKSVRIGMTPAEVEQTFVDVMGDSMPDGFDFHYDEESGYIWTTLDENDGRYNAELVRMTLILGRVVSKSYSPD